MEDPNMKKIFNSILTTAAVVFALAACTKGFEQMNQDPYGVSKEQMRQDGLAIGSMLQNLQRSVFIYRYGEWLDSDYQNMYNLCADAWCGYMTPLGWSEHVGWKVTDQWPKRMWTIKYQLGMGSYLEFMEAVKENGGMENEMALANVLKVATMHHVTDYFGPISYSHFGDLHNLYDAQDAVYNQFFTELDESIETLGAMASSGASILTDYDLVYGGDVVKWVKFANSLRLRLAMRVRFANPELAQTEAEKSIANPYGVIETNSDNAVVAEAPYHPVLSINVEMNDSDVQMGASMDSYLNGYNDPRKFFIAKKAGDGNLHGVRPGISPSSWTSYKNPANKVSAPNASIYKVTWLNAAEVAFLRAEGALVGWNMGGTAKDFYEQGIRLSFEEWGAEGAAAYIANATAKPADFKDAVGRAHTTAPSEVTISWKENASTEDKLEKIATQKWIALFPNGAEAWAEYRRLHYPVLITPSKNYAEDIIPTAQGIRRTPFPVSEQTDNKEGYDSGVAALGGQDNAGTRLWWDKKPFNN